MPAETEEKCDMSAWNIFQALDSLCRSNAACSVELRAFLAKQIWNKQDRQMILAILSKLFLNQKCVTDIGIYFRPLILDIAERTKSAVLKERRTNVRLQHKFAVSLGLLLPICPELERFAAKWITFLKPFSMCDDQEEPKKKKSKREKVSDLDWCRAVYNLVSHMRDASSMISIKAVSDYLSDQNGLVRWYAVQTYCKLIGMCEQKRVQFLRHYFTVQEEQGLLHQCYQETQQREKLVDSALGAVSLTVLETLLTHTHHQLLPSDLDPGVVSVTGVLLPRLSDNTSTHGSVLWVGVPSMLDSLRSLALAVSASRPVLVQGPVGCGKTSLVQHIASMTGRHASPHIIKVQLGDQTDSKALLGTYQCTEVPGQFAWRPGVLTEAVTKGHWVLLEDLDHAPMEVVSTLAPLLQTSTLSVPGHGDIIHAAPGFQLFATQRLFASGDGLHSQNKSSAILDKLWTQVTIQPLSRTELKQIVVTRFPNLPPVVDRLLDIYFMLSAGRHHLTSNLSDLEADDDITESEEDTVGKFLSLTGRLISTRDLMSWCNCVASVFVDGSPASADLILQAALDCFVSCLPNHARRLALAEAIANKLNLTNDKAEYFLSKRMPLVDEDSRQFTVGNVTLACKQQDVVMLARQEPAATFSYTHPSVCLLEKVAACVKRNEPVLLVGETGTGKTSSVQFLAHTLGHRLHVINLNQQSDSVDLLGGFKPVDVKFLIMPLREEFEKLFCKTFSRKQNVEFLKHLQNCFTQKRWHDLLALMEHSWQGAVTLVEKKVEQEKENKAKWHKQQKKWRKMGTRVKKLKAQIKETEHVLAFTFIEGTLVKALKNGDWVLLDEINLAAAETLQCLAGLLESTDGSLVLTDRGNMDPVVRHPHFRLFACMNPATDVGKKDLTPGVRNRFTEFYVDELVEPEDLKKLVGDYLRSLSLTSSQLKGIVSFYTEIRKQAATRLVDGTGHKPHYSLRTLCRALRFIKSHNCGTVARSLFEGFCLSFLTQLDRSSHPLVTSLICQHVLGKAKKESILKQPLPQPGGGKYLQFCGYWISQGTLEPCTPEHYIITASVKENLKDLARVVSAGSHPVLLQGETSVGKTSLITWLARSSGNHCVRVNNHEHTDLQEYVGCYAADESGKLVFKEGVLVEAMRKGYWIILDELNLAPTDVLEALNRLLDDNQELFIPETQEMVKAHPKFMLFATQNPPGHYGGRKMLSRAFRNRFVELHFDEIPKSELETILHQRCGIPLSYAKRLVAVMSDLQLRRQQTGLFAGKQSWMTLRDLFRWADRYKSPVADGNPDVDKSIKFYNYDQHMADHGYMLLAGRVRKPEEAAVIQEVIEKHFKQCKVNPACLFSLSPHTSPTVLAFLQAVVGQSSSPHLSAGVGGFEHVVWTQGMRRLAVLIGQAIQFGEPVLLVGDTGCGKTTICQLYAAMKTKKLHSVNCHLHTESADFLGGLRPVRSHTEEDSKKLFEWVDGPLVTAMKEGSMFLIDEISLADDSVLERLNSVLEPERSILLAEKGGGEGAEDEVEVVKAESGFQVFATMNPGGDFGKKELSPALRNRFTEIWCPQSNNSSDLISIIEHNVRDGVHLSNNEDGSSGFGSAIIDFITWFSGSEVGKRCTVSIRDILSWVHFIDSTTQKRNESQEDEGHLNSLDPAVAYIHGACLVFLDSLGAGTTSRGSDFDSEAARTACLTFLQTQVKDITGHFLSLETLGLQTCVSKGGSEMKVELTQDFLTIFPFSITREVSSVQEEEEQYAMQAPTTCVNAQRILRGLQLSRPLLLEGAPGVGKTSLVAAVARLAGRQLVRINLSEQTDVTDLFGADLPVEGGAGGEFAWRDGPFLQALKAGHWVVFDEMNLASQSVLEGLNACLDHRGEVFVPELSRTFHIQHGRTRIFACQNPLNQGGGRKGLPRSFLNRFTQVYVEPLSRDDLIFICTTMYPRIPQTILSKMVDFNMLMHEETMVKCAWGRKGAPWEFNLRDINRWCDLLLHNQATSQLDAGQYVSLIYQDRMRTAADKDKVCQLYHQVFGADSPMYQPSHILRVATSHLQVGSSSCGKSSVVQLLAELSGHTLHVLPMSSAMDTTELLGGFEQADIGRHIAELTAEVVHEVRTYQQQRLVKGDAAAVSVVTSLDQHLIALKTQTEDDVEEDSEKEREALLSRIQLLQTLVSKMSKLQPKSERLSQLTASLKREQHVLKKAGLGSGSVGGGTFEWVDSLLVKALRKGHWLLIDNVNFCSPSVLDRLNGLLEPGGVLTINERGVTDSSVPTIIPHPDFRLFLSMDPKYGEISRAMRNRGVEIYMLGEGDGFSYSQLDLLSMLHGVGLHSQLACDWLMELQEQLSDKLTMNEKPGLTDLLRCAMVVKQQQEKGVDQASALSHAAHTVYVRNMKSLAARQVVCSVLSEQLEKLKNPDTTSLSCEEGCVEWSLVVPSVDQYQDHSGFTTAQQAGKVFTLLLSHYTPDRYCPIAKTSLNQFLRGLQTALNVFMMHQTEQTWRLAFDWLKKTVSQKKDRAALSVASQAPDDQKKFERELTRLMQTGETCLHTLFGSRALRDFHEAERRLCEGSNYAEELLGEQPWDLGTNPQVVEKVLLLLLTNNTNTDGVRKRFETFKSSINRLELLQAVIVMKEQLGDGLKTLEELSDRVKHHKSESSKVLFHLCEMYKCLMNHLCDLITCLPSASVTLLHQMQDRLLWLGRLLEETVSRRSIEEVEEVYLSQLALHWHWCWHKLLTHLVTPNSAPGVQSSVQKVRTLLGDDNTAAKLFVKFWSAWGHPQAFPTEMEARLWQEFSSLAATLLVDGSTRLEVAQPKVKALATSDGKILQRKLTFVAKKLLNGDFDVNADLSSIRGLLTTLQLVHAESSTTAQDSSTPPMPRADHSTSSSSFVQLWPVYEHLGLLTELSSLVFGCSEGQNQERKLRLQDYKIHCSPSAVCYDLYREQVFGQGEQMKWLLHVLQQLWSSPAAANCTRWLTWAADPDTVVPEASSQETNGPAVFHRSPVMLFASHLLSSAQSTSKTRSMLSHYDLLPLSMTLGAIEEQLSQLDKFSRHLWINAGALSTDMLSLRSLEAQLLAHSFMSLLCTLTHIMDVSSQEEWSSLLNSLPTSNSSINPTASSPTLLQTWQQNGAVVKSVLFQLSNHLSQHCSLVMQDNCSGSPVPAILGRCFEVMVEVVGSQGSTSMVGQALVYVGLSLFHLLAPKGPVDPVHKATVKLLHFQQELTDVETDIQVWETHLKLTRGQTIQDVNPELHHPTLTFLLQRQRDLATVIADLEKQHAFRGNATQYIRLSQDVTSLLETMASTSTVGGLVSRLRTSVNSSQAEFCSMVAMTTAAAREERTWQNATGRFSKKLGAEYPYLPDLTVPVCLAVEQMRLGMRTLAQEAQLRLKQSQIKFWPGTGQLEGMVSSLSVFPSVRPSTPTWLLLASKLSSLATREAVTCLLTCENGPPTQPLLSRLLSCSLQLLKTHALQSGRLTPDLCMTLTHVLDLFVKAWQDQEDSRRRKEEEEASLYRYKDQTHLDERTEEEKEEEDFREAFPSFRDDFADMIEATRLEDTGRKEQPMEEEGAAPDAITEEEMDEVCTSHVHLFHQLTATSWLAMKAQTAAGSLDSWDVLKPFLLAYQVATRIGQNSWELLSEEVDKCGLGSHLMVCGTLAHSVSALGQSGGNAEALQPPAAKCYNVYVDPNVEEVIQCRPVLQGLVARVKELLQEWPQHPVLNQLLQLVERIESFPVTSPIVKFLTGMELLLEKAQHWERNAASHVSLATQLSEVTTIIVRWRKLELRCWSGALDIEVERCRRKASRWWFHLYTLLSTYLAQDKSDVDPDKLLASLKQFMEGSTLGEFSARLDIVLAFHCQLVHTPASPQRDHLLRLLWNLHQFYSQFRPALEAEVTQLRAPIEKELKGFVKIARWSEMNYWALKESTEKTHRTVHKHARAFQAQLNQPVKGYLGEKPSDFFSDSTAASSDYSQRVMAFHHHSLQQADMPTDACVQQAVGELLPGLTHLPEHSLQQKLPSLCQRAAKHWRSCLKASDICEDISALDELTGELIEEAHELQKLEVPQGTDKDKQKAEVKHIHLRKRKALADCFKQLSSLGLSFKKGLLKEKTNHVDHALQQLPPLNPAACLEKGSRLPGLWEGCDVYFTRCLSRLAQFAVSMQSPSQDLGTDNIQRCHGFTEHLATLFLSHRQELSDVFSTFVSFKKMMAAVNSLMDDVILVSQTETHQWLESVKTEVTQIIQGLTQFHLLLQACPPASPTPDAHVASPFLPAELPPMAHLHHGDELWHKCVTSVLTYVDAAKKIQASLSSLTDRLLFTSGDISILASAVAQLMPISYGLQEMMDALNNNHNNSCLTATISFLSTSTSSLHSRFMSWKQDQQTLAMLKTNRDTELTSMSAAAQDVVKNFAEKVERLVELTLLSIQKLKKHDEEDRNAGADKAKGTAEDEEEQEDGLKDNHLTVLMQQLQKHASCLHTQKLTKGMEELCDLLKEMADSTGSHGETDSTNQMSVCTQLLLQCQPLLSVYSRVLETHVARSLALHRTLGKMLSVMLAVFTQLMLKGFCLPAEYSDEAGGEGATDFVDVEGGGFGEGEGAKDVSEQIESQEQLDEARRPDEEKEDSTGQQPDIAPEKNAIEMSEDFDAKPEDMEPVEGEDDEEEKEDKEEEEELDKQMGEVDGPNSDKLDDQMWGSDEEEETEDKDQKEEEGPGSGPQGEKELAAKEDLPSGTEDKEEKKEDQQQNDEDGENNEEPKMNEIPDFDESEYDDNRTDPYHGEEDKNDEPENMDLPDDLNLDQDEPGEEDDGGGEPPGEGEETAELPEMMEEADNEGGDEKTGEDKEDNENEKNDGDKEENEGQKEEENSEQEKNEETSAAEEEKMETDDPDEEKEAKDDEKKKEVAGPEELDDDEETDTKGIQSQKQNEAKGEEDREEGEQEEKVERAQASHDTAGEQQNEDAQEETAGVNDQDEAEGSGQASTEQQDGHEGSSSTQVTEGTAASERKQTQRRPGQSKEDRSLGSADEKFRRLKTTDQSSDKQQPEKTAVEEQEAELYEHITDDTSHADAQTLDAATDQQQRQQQVVGKAEEEEGDQLPEDDDVKMMEEEEEDQEKHPEKPAKDTGRQQKPDKSNVGGEEKNGDPMEVEKTEIEGSMVDTLGAERPPESTIHTHLEHLHLGAAISEEDVETLRGQLEDSMTNWTHGDGTDPQAAAAAGEAWQKYEALTSSLSQELCEQLRLVLEPSQATKLRGDYRTGKRLNMRKVIPYIASQFRKDKIWLRRTKPSKRQYQIMLAIDDSRSMTSNHSAQLALESLALTANALTLLETGELAVCSFGEKIQLLHPFTEPFSAQAGARILQQFTFEQNQTLVSQMLQQATAVMLEARSKQQGWMGRPETAQLLLIVSDGRGVNGEGMSVVRKAVRQAREANIFLVFIILDDPKNMSSILDIKITDFSQGNVTFKSYMEEFPFPFYVILRDINTLPQVLSDALRQWFELVTASST